MRRINWLVSEGRGNEAGALARAVQAMEAMWEGDPMMTLLRRG